MWILALIAVIASIAGTKNRFLRISWKEFLWPCSIGLVFGIGQYVLMRDVHESLGLAPLHPSFPILYALDMGLTLLGWYLIVRWICRWWKPDGLSTRWYTQMTDTTSEEESEKPRDT